MPLQNDYRPSNLDEFFGNDALVTNLKVLLEREDKPHTYLLSGPSGCGKTTLARIIGKMLGCKGMDFLELNISNMRGIDMAREIIQSCKFQPLYGERRTIVLNECHKATNEFQNAMLEILEEPDSHTYFILCTTEPEKLLKTIKTRATHFIVNPLKRQEAANLVHWIIESEGKSISEKVLNSLLHSTDGCPRMLVKVLDQIIDLSDESQQLEMIILSGSDEITTKDICQAIAAKKSGAERWAKLSILLRVVENQDAESIRRAILGYLTNYLLNTKGDEGKRVALLISEFSNNYYDSGRAGLISSCFMSTLI